MSYSSLTAPTFVTKDVLCDATDAKENIHINKNLLLSNKYNMDL